jgi:23S rRNA G2445 N2-methylase RlmL
MGDRRVFALTSRGLEPIGAREMGALPGVAVERIAYRRVVAVCDGPLSPLLGLRTVDDVFLDVAVWEGVGRPRSALAALRNMSGRLDLPAAAAACGELRPVSDRPRFSVTASFVGRRNYSTAEIKRACAEGIASGHGWMYDADDDVAELNVRVFLEHETAYVGLRLGAGPLHRRRYKRAHVPGSLKPPVAAALLSLAGMEPGLRVLDPCCGAGTIPIEAALSGAASIGGDGDARAVEAARANAAAAGVPVALRAWDARSLPLAGGSVDRVVSNLPWGREVAVGGAVEDVYRRICGEIERVLTPGGRAALLVGEPRLVRVCGLVCEKAIEISLFGQRPTVVVLA